MMGISVHPELQNFKQLERLEPSLCFQRFEPFDVIQARLRAAVEQLERFAPFIHTAELHSSPRDDNS
jgi:hypothetical protein